MLQSTCVALMWFGETTSSEENRLGELRLNGKDARKDEVTGEIIKCGGDRVVD